jgi:beta-glucosidase
MYYGQKNTGRPLGQGQWFQKFRSNYLDVSNDPVYPFGYGLSYTSFNYSDIALDKTEMTGSDSLHVSIEVSNTGSRDGSEVVQLYIRDLVGSVTRPIKELKAFNKVMLKAGEKKTITFTLSTKDLSFYKGDLSFGYEPGKFHVFVGGNSRDVKQAEFVVK